MYIMMLPRKSKVLNRIIYTLVLCALIIWYLDIYSWLVFDNDKDKLSSMDMPRLIDLYKQLRREEINITCNVNITIPNDTFVYKLRTCLLSMLHVRYLNPHPFQYTMNPIYVCESGEPFLLIYVHSAPQHQRRRLIIRKTWGQVNNDVRLVFLMGMPNSLSLQNELTFENDLYGDLVQENFLDSYRNLTYKAIMGLRWVGIYCRHAKFVLKSDDDVFVDVFAVLRHLRRLTTRPGVTDAARVTGLLQCMVWYRMKVMRDRKSKWFVPYEDYSPPYFPTYCSGLAFIASTDVIGEMAVASRLVRFFWVDDVFVTGTLAAYVGISHRSIGWFASVGAPEWLLRNWARDSTFCDS